MLRHALLATTLVFAACSSSSPSKNADAPSSVDANSKSFATVYAQVIMPNCGCHTSAGGEGITEGMLDMTSESTAYSNLVGIAAMGTSCSGMGTRVVAGSATTSILYEKINPTSTRCGSQMPLGGSSLSSADVTLVEDWINSGAGK